MVLPDSHAVPLIARYLGTSRESVWSFNIRGYHPLGPIFPNRFDEIRQDFFPLEFEFQHVSPTTPSWQRLEAWHHKGLGYFRFRSPLLTESMIFLFLGVLRCFNSPRVATSAYEFSKCSSCDHDGVAPFGHLRIKVCLQLPEAYRSLPRPSSPISAKSSTNGS